MKRPTLTTSLALSLALAAAAAQASPGRWHDDGARYAWARVQSVAPIYAQDTRPQRTCWQQPAGRYYTSDDHSTAGTVLGAIVGGVLGNTIGKGDGRRAATVAGAVIGGAIGNHAGRGDGAVVEHDRYVQRCRTDTVYGPRRVIGYDVSYRFRGRIYRTRMDHDPGRRMRVMVEDRVRPAE